MDDLASLNLALLRAKVSRLQQAHPNDEGYKKSRDEIAAFQQSSLKY
jgi:hypothetical protein